MNVTYHVTTYCALPRYTTCELSVGRMEGCDPPNAGYQPTTFGGTRPWFRPYTDLRTCVEMPPATLQRRRYRTAGAVKAAFPRGSVTALS